MNYKELLFAGVEMSEERLSCDKDNIGVTLEENFSNYFLGD